MSYDINIFGEIVPFAYPEDASAVNLSDIEKMLSAANGKDITVNINSPGGDVDEGFLIYTALRKYAKDNNAKVTTYAKGRCHSIATVIFLSGDERVANKFLEPFVHNAWAFAVGDSGELMRTAVDLENINKRIAKFYAEHTDLTYEEARNLMDNDSYISPDEAVRIRFATKIEEIMRPVALSNIFNKKNNKKMSKNNKEAGFIKKLARALALVDAKNLEVFTSTSESIVFSDLEDGAEPKAGDKATIDGKAAEGRYTLADGTVYVFVADVLEEIITDDGGDEDRIEELEKENEELRDRIEALNSTVSRISKAQKEHEKMWKNLKSTVSDYIVDDKSNEDKSLGSQNKTGLSAAAARLKSRRNKV